MKRESLIALLDNIAMITESMLKKELTNYTGRIKFRTVRRTNYQGTASWNINSNKVSFVISFEHTNNRNVFHDLYTKNNELKEFASLNSVVNYLNKLNFLSSVSLSGEIYEQESCDEET